MTDAGLNDPHPRSSLWAWLLLVGGLTGSLVAQNYIQRNVEEDSRKHGEFIAQQANRVVRERLDAGVHFLKDTQALFNNAPQAGRADFRRHVQKNVLADAHSGIEAVGFVRMVPRPDLTKYENRVRRDTSIEAKGYPLFAVMSRQHGDVLYVLDYLESLPGNRSGKDKPFGDDLAADPARKLFIEKVRDTGQLVVDGARMALPVYRRGAPLQSVEARRKAFVGVVAADFDLNGVLRDAFGETFPAQASVRVFDAQALEESNGAAGRKPLPAPLFDSRTVDAAGAGFAGESAHEHWFPLDVAGQHWRVLVATRPATVSGLRGVFFWGILLGGGLISLLSFLYLRSFAKVRERVEHMASRLGRERLGQVVGALNIVVWSMSLPNRKLEYINVAAEKLYGYPLSSFYADPSFWLGLVHEDDRERAQAAAEAQMRGIGKDIEYRIICKDGEIRWLHDRSWVTCDENGVPIRVDGSASDITERKRNELQLRQLSQVVEQSPAVVLITDIKGNIEYVNPKFTDVTGYSFEEVRGKTPRLLSSTKTPHAVYDELWQTILAGKDWHGELLNRRKDGRLFWESETISSIRDANGRISHFVAVKEDISEHKRMIEELQRNNRTLKMLSDCNRALVRAASEAELLDQFCKSMVEAGVYVFAWIGFAENDEARTLRPALMSGCGTECLALQDMSWGDNARGQQPAAIAIRSGQPFVMSCDRNPLRHAADCPAGRQRELAGCMEIDLPLSGGGQPFGVLSVFAPGEGVLDPAEMSLLVELADGLAFGIASLRSATARRQAEAALILHERAIESSVNGIMISDVALPDNPIIYVNPSFERITGYRPEDAIGRNGRFLLNDDRAQMPLEELRNALRERRETKVVLRNYRKDGSQFWNELSMAPVRDATGKVTHFVSVINDVTESKRYEQQLEYQSNYDALTGLPNRNLLNDRLEQGITHANRYERQMAVLFVDLDRFKVINESQGREIGDGLLKVIAQRLIECQNDGDTVAHLTSDEFVYVVSGFETQDEVASVARKLLSAIAVPLMLNGLEMYPTASIGISVYPKDGANGETLLRNADAAMYRAKDEGGNQFRYYAQEMNARISTRVGLEAELHRALERNQLQLCYQPKVDFATGEIVAAEALVRWHHPTLGQVSPGEFIPLAEEMGLILSIGEWVLQTACTQNKAWQEAGLPSIVMAVNLSARQFKDEKLFETISRVLRESDLHPKYLELELTESMVMHNPTGAIATMRQLKSLGVSLATDDFGTGYSSLSYLKRFPIDTLKIDQSFVRDITTDPDDAAIVLAVIAMAHSMKLKVIAEGVETESQLNFLRDYRCNEMQGYYFSRPLSAEDFAALLKARKTLGDVSSGAILIPDCPASKGETLQ